MREIFNPAAIRCALAMFAVLAVLLALVATSNSDALATCQATHSAGVCEYTLK